MEMMIATLRIAWVGTMFDACLNNTIVTGTLWSKKRIPTCSSTFLVRHNLRLKTLSWAATLFSQRTRRKSKDRFNCSWDSRRKLGRKTPIFKSSQVTRVTTLLQATRVTWKDLKLKYTLRLPTNNSLETKTLYYLANPPQTKKWQTSTMETKRRRTILLSRLFLTHLTTKKRRPKRTKKSPKPPLTSA